MRYAFRRALIIQLMFAVAACTSTGATKRGVVGFNQVFADSRNEILLRNILRARYGDPLQFSTISNVNGDMRPGMTGEATLSSLADSLAKIVSPKATVTLRNPTVTIAPLETKEFRQGMVKPLDPKLVGELVKQGWSPAVVLHLVVAGASCPARPEAHLEAWRFADHASLETIKEPTEETIQEIAIPAAAALRMAREGGGEKVKVEIVKSKPKDPAGTLRVSVKRAQADKLMIKDSDPACIYNLELGDEHLRSPLAMIQYLGDIAFDGNTYFEIRRGRPAPGDFPITETQFLNGWFYIPRGGNSAETLALLAEIIGFQTSDATLNASKPAVTVPTGS